MSALWSIELLGGLRVRRVDTGQTFNRFRSRRAASLLAFLAYHPRPHPREVLIELLWSGHNLQLSRSHLRVILSSLRQLLEPPDVPRGSIILADRHCIGLRPGAVTTDVAEFETTLQNAAQSTVPVQRINFLAQAVEGYPGPLLPGYYEDWVVPAARRLEELFFGALRQLIAELEAEGNQVRAIEYARHGISKDPLREEIHRDLMRLYAASGQYALALRQYQEFERLLKQRLNTVPGPATRELRQRIESDFNSDIEPVDPGARSVDALPATFVSSRPEPDSGGLTLPHANAALHLPLQRTHFFGRQAEIGQLQKLLFQDKTRLLTLTGPGGSGKTRLALEVARRFEDAWQGTIWFVPLADLADAGLIAEEIADALRLSRLPHLTPLNQVLHFLNSHAANTHPPALLVLDNFEHLLPAGTPLIQALLARVPHLQLLITSRHELRIADEYLFPVPLLPVPQLPVPGEHLDADGLLNFASVQLFYDRARAARPNFRITRHNAPALARLCVHLEGLPLAIELAAARAATLSASRIATRLERRLDFLTEQAPHSTYRYPTLRASLEWSYALLWPELQRFFASLSVFRGGFTAEAAAIVAQEDRAAHYLQQLRIASLVIRENNGGTRFRLLETIREFALELVASSGEDAALRQRHAEFYLSLAETAYPKLLGSPEQPQWMDRLEKEQDNLRAALAWLLDHEPAGHPPGRGLRLAMMLARFWRIIGRDIELHEALTRAWERGDDAPVEVRAIALREIGEVLLRLGGYGDWAEQNNYQHAMEILEESAALSRQAGDLQNLAWTLRKLGEGAQYAGHDMNRARVYFEESLAIERNRNDPFTLGNAVSYVAGMTRDMGDFKEAWALYEESATLYRAIHHAGGVAKSLIQLALLAYRQNNIPLARSYWEQSLPTLRDLKDKATLVWALDCLSHRAGDRGDYEAARALSEEHLRLGREMESNQEILLAFRHLVKVARQEKNYREARSLLWQAMTIVRESGNRAYLRNVLVDFAQLAAAQQQWERSARLSGAVQALGRDGDASLPEGRVAVHDVTLTAARAALDEAAFDAAWTQGCAMSPEQAIEYALQEDAPATPNEAQR